MNYENYKPDWNKPSIFTAQQFGTKISVEVERSDMNLDEVMDALQTLIIGLGYHENSFKNWVINRADEYNETDAEDLKEKLEAWKFEDDNIVLRHNFPTINTEEDDFFGKWDDYNATLDQDEDRYRATDEDENEFDDYGKRIEKDAVSFEWGDEPEEDYDGQFNDWKNETPEDDDLFEADEWKTNENLKSANKRYKAEVKKMNTKQKRNSKK
jgi:hypothetical protein